MCNNTGEAVGIGVLFGAGSTLTTDGNVTISVSVSTLVWSIVDGTLFVIIVSGNLVTLYVLRSSLQFTPLISSQLVMSLALSDTLVGLTIPYHMAITLAPQLANSRLTCTLKFVFILFGCCASILNMTAIAADRYFAIIHPFTYERIMNSRMVNTVLCGGWIHAVIFSTVPLYWNNWRLNKPCELGRILPRYYTTAIITPAFLLIWATMFLLYWRIWREAVQQANKMRQLHVCHLRRSCLQVVLLIMGCFTFCWLPFLIAACIQAAGHPDLITPLRYKVVLTLAISSSAINPLLYAWKNAEFKRTFGHMLRCRTASHSLQYDRDKHHQHRNSPLHLFTNNDSSECHGNANANELQEL